MGKKSSRVVRRLSKEKSRFRKTRPKTFTSEKLAETWAKANNVSDYELKNLKSQESSTKKIQVILK